MLLCWIIVLQAFLGTTGYSTLPVYQLVKPAWENGAKAGKDKAGEGKSRHNTPQHNLVTHHHTGTA